MMPGHEEDGVWCWFLACWATSKVKTKGIPPATLGARAGSVYPVTELARAPGGLVCVSLRKLAPLVAAPTLVDLKRDVLFLVICINVVQVRRNAPALGPPRPTSIRVKPSTSTFLSFVCRISHFPNLGRLNSRNRFARLTSALTLDPSLRLTRPSKEKPSRFALARYRHIARATTYGNKTGRVQSTFAQPAWR